MSSKLRKKGLRKRRLRRKQRLKAGKGKGLALEAHPGSYGGSITVRNADGRTAPPSHVVAPIMMASKMGILTPIGTGFFVSSNGLFLTAAHVVEELCDVDPGITPLIVQFREEGYIARRIQQTVSHETADLALGISNAPEKLQQTMRLSLTTEPPGFGSEIATYAFPSSEVKNKPDGSLNLVLSPDYFAGVLNKEYPHGRDKTILPGRCFETTILIHGGASGGPVFDRAGAVFAVNSTGIIGGGPSHITPISEAMKLQLPNMPSFKALCESGVIDLV